jgi:hypothetical protein
MRPNTSIIRGSYLAKQVVEDYKAKMELDNVGTFSPGLTVIRYKYVKDITLTMKANGTVDS